MGFVSRHSNITHQENKENNKIVFQFIVLGFLAYLWYLILTMLKQ